MHRNAQKLVWLEAVTGKRRSGRWTGRVLKVPSWPRVESPDVYASPFVWEGEGGPLLIAHGNDYCTAHKLDDGTEVWRVPGLNPTGNGAWRFISSPLVTPDLIVVPSCKSGPTVGLNPVGTEELSAKTTVPCCGGCPTLHPMSAARCGSRMWFISSALAGS